MNAPMAPRVWSSARRAYPGLERARARRTAPDRRDRRCGRDRRCSVILTGDRVCLEGNNQKQADFLARALTEVVARVHGLHMVQSVLALRHLDVLRRRRARLLLLGPAKRRGS
jgi:hypothetical protein